MSSVLSLSLSMFEVAHALASLINGCIELSSSDILSGEQTSVVVSHQDNFCSVVS